MEVIQVAHSRGTTGDGMTNVGIIAAAISGGEISCSWRCALPAGPGNVVGEGGAMFRASSPIYRSDNAAASGVMAIPLNRAYSTFAAVTFLNNSEAEATLTLNVAVGNHDGSTKSATEVTAKVPPGGSKSYQVAFTLG